MNNWGVQVGKSSTVTRFNSRSIVQLLSMVFGGVRAFVGAQANICKSFLR